MRRDSNSQSEMNLTADYFIEIWLIENVISYESVKVKALNEIKRLAEIANMTFLNEMTELAKTDAIRFLNETVQMIKSIEVTFLTEMTKVAD